MRKVIATMMLFVLLTMSAIRRQNVERQKVGYLIDSVATLKDATFMRNGAAHDAVQAVDPMQLKLRFSGNRVKTAENFTAYCGTGSTMSGKAHPSLPRRPHRRSCCLTA